MSFYTVPAMLYQQQQKMKQHQRKRAQRKSDRGSTSEKSDARSQYSRSSRQDTSSLSSEPHHASTKQEDALSSSLNTTSIDSSLGSLIPQVSQQGIDRLSSPASRSEDGRLLSSAETSRRASLVSMASFATSKLSRNQKKASITSFEASEGPHHALRESSQSSQVTTGQRIVTRALDDIPKFVPFTELTCLNSKEALRTVFINPSFAEQRFNTFLNDLEDHHVNDAINFAAIRNQSLAKFVKRQRASKNYWLTTNTIEQGKDLCYYEDLLSFELLRCREFLRNLIRQKAALNRAKNFDHVPEELIQGNFINYVRFLVSLPDISEELLAQLEFEQRKHFEFKRFFDEVSDALYAIKKIGFDDELSVPSSRLDILIRMIVKTSHEFILLEKYNIQILAKLANNHLIESRTTKDLFQKYQVCLQSTRMHSVKVLVFNTYFSANYSWYLAVTTPFVRVFETGSFNESMFLADNASSHTLSSTQYSKDETFGKSDIPLYQEFYQKLHLKDFSAFCKLSRKDLCKFQKMVAEHSERGEDAAPTKPINFEYIDGPMSTIALETFQVIQCRDFQLQAPSVAFEQALLQFHRILRHGGILEIPFLVPAGTRPAKRDQTTECSFSNTSFTECESQCGKPYVVQLEKLLGSIYNLFGPHSVKFSTILLTTKNELNEFLIKHSRMTEYEMSGRFEDFTEFSGDVETSSGEILHEVHCMYYVKATKK